MIRTSKTRYGGNGLKEEETLIASHRRQAVNSAAERFWGTAALHCKIVLAPQPTFGECLCSVYSRKFLVQPVWIVTTPGEIIADVRVRRMMSGPSRASEL